MELATIIRSGGLIKSRNLMRHEVRERVLDNADEVPFNKWCKHCKGECYSTFTGKMLIVIGLNNCLKADDWPFIQERNGRMENVQVCLVIIIL